MLKVKVINSSEVAEVTAAVVVHVERSAAAVKIMAGVHLGEQLLRRKRHRASFVSRRTPWEFLIAQKTPHVRRVYATINMVRRLASLGKGVPSI